jgi:hypothetical protein
MVPAEIGVALDPSRRSTARPRRSAGAGPAAAVGSLGSASGGTTVEGICPVYRTEVGGALSRSPAERHQMKR